MAICGRDPEGVTSAVARLLEQGVRAFGAAIDVAGGEALETFIVDAAAALNGIDVFVANASSLVDGNAEGEWRRAFECDSWAPCAPPPCPVPFSKMRQGSVGARHS